MDNLQNVNAADIKIQEDRENSATNAIIAASAVGGGKFAYDKYAKEGTPLASLYSKLLGTQFLDRQLDKSITWSSGSKSAISSSVMKSMLSQFMAIEEASPLHILRTLQISNITSPFVNIASSDQEIIFSARKLKYQQHYYEAMINFANRDLEEKVRKKLIQESLANGLVYKNGSLYLNKQGAADLDNLVVRAAKLSLSNIRQGDINSPNHMVYNYSSAIGSKLDLDSLKSDPLVVLGAKSNRDFGMKWGNSWLRYVTGIGMKSLDNPLAGVEDLLKSTGLDHTSFFESKGWLAVKNRLNINLGTNGVYDTSVRQMLKEGGKNFAIKSTKILGGYAVADQVVRGLSGPDTLFNNGIYNGLLSLYGATRVKTAEIWSDRFQGYKDSQEKAAEGSTNLLTLASLPLAGALLGSQVSYFKRIGKTIVSNTDEAAKIYNVAEVSPTLSKIGINTELKPMRRNAIYGAIAGAALALPFLPGALIGSSSEELKEIYSGKKDVAQRANKYWMMGGGDIEGSHIKYFTKSAIALSRADVTDKVRYGDDATKDSMNPFLHPFSYLRNPYRYEKMHKDDMPYPVWGMEVSYGSIYGKLFERTVGQIIKPDVINPEIFHNGYESSKESGTIKEAVTKGIISYVGKSLFGDSKLDDMNPYPVKMNSNDTSLNKSGILARPESGRYDPNLEASMLGYQSAVDLIGLKGWIGSMPLDKVGVGAEHTPLQLAKSGEATSAARDLRAANLGDLLGLGEFQRKVLGTSSASLPDRYNPLYNNMPRWLPSSDTQYFINFSKGNPYQSIEQGEARLPGKGLESLYPELKGVDPNNYPLIYKYKILSDVAKGSREHIRARQQLLSAQSAGKLSPTESKMLEETLDQEVQRDNRKSFYKSGEASGPISLLQSTLWNGIVKHGESPLEMLTPLRPMAKFMHKRTAIEDYVQTQLGGTDTAIWTNPYDHFIKPTLNKSRLVLDSDFKPEEKVSKDLINEYFDKIGHIKNRIDSNPTNDFNSVLASSMSGLNTKDKVLKFKKNLSADERDYFEDFSKETNEKKRDKIRAILPKDVLRGYEQIWRNVDTATKARNNGTSVQYAIAEDLHEQTKNLKQSFNIQLSKQDKALAIKKVSSNTDSYSDMGFTRDQRIKYTEDELVRLRMADSEANTYIANSTGKISKKFLGWDPRLSVDDIKIRTLSIGGEDLKRFGFWKSDEDRMNRIPALKSENDVVHSLSKIKKEMRANTYMKKQIEDIMFSNGFKVNNVRIVNSDFGELRINGENSNGN